MLKLNQERRVELLEALLVTRPRISTRALLHYFTQNCIVHVTYSSSLGSGLMCAVSSPARNASAKAASAVSLKSAVDP